MFIYFWALKSPFGRKKPCPSHGVPGECCAGGETSPAVAEQLVEVQEISATSKARIPWDLPMGFHGAGAASETKSWYTLIWFDDDDDDIVINYYYLGPMMHAHDFRKCQVDQYGVSLETRPRDRMGVYLQMGM